MEYFMIRKGNVISFRMVVTTRLKIQRFRQFIEQTEEKSYELARLIVKKIMKSSWREIFFIHPEGKGELETDQRE